MKERSIQADALRRMRITVTYDGTAYSGWQRQANAPSIQQALEEAHAKLTGETIAFNGASRTDAGVHALGQVVHYDTRAKIPPDKLPMAFNTKLPRDIRVVDAAFMPFDFSARFSARGKLYRYLIHNSRYASALYRNQRAHVIPPLDADLMQQAAQTVLGSHDFAAFAASGSEAKSTIREIRLCDVQRHGELIEIYVSGRSFLYNMVRILAGALIYIGMQKLPPDALETALRTGNRLDLGITAPAHGLTLMQVYYADDQVPTEVPGGGGTASLS